MKGAVRAIRIFQAMAAQGWRGRAIASFLYGVLRLLRPRGDRIDSNLRLVYPAKDRAWRAELRRGVYRNLAWTVTEVLALQRDHRQAFDWISEVEGEDILAERLKDPGGGILLSGHFGNWELLGSWFSQRFRERGRQLYVLYQEIHDHDIAALVREYREASGMRVLPKEASTLDMVRMLRGGAWIGVLTDVSWAGGVTLPFMGQPCTNAPGPAVLAMLSSVPIVPLAAYRQGPFRHALRFLDPISVPKEGNREERIELTLRAINRALEEIIAPRPELWFWLHNRWK